MLPESSAYSQSPSGVVLAAFSYGSKIALLLLLVGLLTYQAIILPQPLPDPPSEARVLLGCQLVGTLLWIAIHTLWLLRGTEGAGLFFALLPISIPLAISAIRTLDWAINLKWHIMSGVFSGPYYLAGVACLVGGPLSSLLLGRHAARHPDDARYLVPMSVLCSCTTIWAIFYGVSETMIAIGLSLEHGLRGLAH